VPFVQAGDQDGSQHRESRPAKSPSGAIDVRQSFAPGAEQQNAQHSIAEDVPALADVEVQMLEVPVVHPKQEMQQRIKHAAGVVGRGEVRRFNGDDDQPQDCGDPGLQNPVAVGAQAGVESVVGKSPLLAKDARKGASGFEKEARRFLFDGIVGSLASDHDVMDVAFAQAGPTDAHEARLL